MELFAWVWWLVVVTVAGGSELTARRALGKKTQQHGQGVCCMLQGGTC